MAIESSLHQRRRAPTDTEIAGIPWLGLLQAAERARALERLEVGDATVFARLIEGAFPGYEQIIPSESTTRVGVDTAAFRQAVRVAGLFGGMGDARPVMLEAEPERLRLRARGDQTGEAEGELPATLDGTPQRVVLNTRLLGEVLEAASDAHLEIAWSSPRTPVVVREAGNGAGDLWVVMPLYDPALLGAETPAAQPEQRAA